MCRDDVRAELMKIDESRIVSIMNEYIRVAKEGTAKENGFPEFRTNQQENCSSMTPYLMSKTGITLLGMLYGLRASKLANGVLVNSCCPGVVETDMTKDMVGFDREKKSPDNGADTPVYLALLPQGSDIQGRFLIDRMDKTEVFMRGEHFLVPKTPIAKTS